MRLACLLAPCLWITTTGAALTQSAESMIDGARLRLDRAGCTADDDDGTVVVCARDGSRYRLPLPRAVEPMVDAARGSGAAALVPPAPCGIFAGQRRCGKAEAARYGYGNGRDPITVAGRVLGIVEAPAPPIEPRR